MMAGRRLHLEPDTLPGLRPAGHPDWVAPMLRGQPAGRKVHWTRPELVAEVSFTEWTTDGKMRHPSYKGLRGDKPAVQVVRERPLSGAGTERG